MITISKAGSFRQPVVVIGRWALKFARNAEGVSCNKYEAHLYRSVSEKRRSMLCPVVWISPGGRLLIMAAAIPRTSDLTPEEYTDLFEEWDYMPGEDSCPFEPKALDWGWYQGKLVALDYSTPAWGND
jgi:hypothetical protein